MDWNLEPFVAIVNKQQPLFVQAGSEQAIRDAIAWADTQGVNIVIRTSPATAVASASLLRARSVPVILSNVLAMPQGEDTFHAANYQAAGLLAKAGVLFAFSSGGYQNVRLVPFQAAMSVAWGLSHEDAIKALTINPARIFGADRVLGTIEAGKVANLIVVTGDPLEIRSRIRHVVIAGRSVPLESKHTELFTRYMGRQ
jgi:imidazolonepropionase-like amidohydrolase